MGHFIDQGKLRSPEVLALRAQRAGLGAALQCKKCGAIVFTQKMKDAVAAPKTHQALARQASEKHEAVCPKREEAKADDPDARSAD